jgi:hypothetical protein
MIERGKNMNIPFYRESVLIAILILTLLFPISNAKADNWKEWKPIDPNHLSMKTPIVEKDADAEAIFWEVRVADEMDGGSPRTVHTNYIRIKIFTERGRESQSRVDIPFGKINGKKIEIKDIAGRTIKPDGSIVELKKEDIYERTIVKTGGIKLKAKTFAMPAIEPGALIEYRWREVIGDNISFYDRLEFSREIPVQSVKYYLKPISIPGFPFGMRINTFRMDIGSLKKEKDGFHSMVLTNVPAFKEESRMPPSYEARPWVLVYYAEDLKLSPNQYWKNYSKGIYEDTKSQMKVNDEIKRASAEIIGDASTPEQKLERIFDYCRFKIKLLNDDASGLSEEEIKKAKKNKSASDTLKRGIGTGWDIYMLFCALANAAGFDARMSSVANRGDVFFNKELANSYFIDPAHVAVKVGDKWRFYDPATTYVPHGMLRWQEEGQLAIIADPNELIWAQTPISSPDKSKEKSIAKLKLSEDGTLEGDVIVEYTGHLAVHMKEYDDDDTPTEREETLKKRIKDRISNAEVTNIKIENVTDPIKPFTYKYHIKVPNYAVRTGKRLLVQPAFFQYGIAPLFPGNTRKNPVYFHYFWSEEDRVEIEIPEGFLLDNAQAPSSFGAGDISQYKVSASISKDNRWLIYTRNFYFGGRDMILFPLENYAVLKKYFDEVHKQDNHTLAFKIEATSASK